MRPQLKKKDISSRKLERKEKNISVIYLIWLLEKIQEYLQLALIQNFSRISGEKGLYKINSIPPFQQQSSVKIEIFKRYSIQILKKIQHSPYLSPSFPMKAGSTCPRLPYSPVASNFLHQQSQPLRIWEWGVIRWKRQLYSRSVCMARLLAFGYFGVSREQALRSVPWVLALLQRIAHAVAAVGVFF